jgi:AcrR family transcriptional regulator
MPRWEPNARLRLVESALELFEERGYEDTAVADIAARAGLTKTTFFRHFPNKREVLSAGQDFHSQTLAAAISGAPAAATTLEAVAVALDALSGTFPPERRTFAARLLTVIDASPELQERAALKQAGYVAAIRAGLIARGVSELTATVAAELGHLAFTTGYAQWAAADTPKDLTELVRAALTEIHTTSLALS